MSRLGLAIEAGPVETGADEAADTSFDTSFNFGFDFGPSEEISTHRGGECFGLGCGAWDCGGELQSVCPGGA